MNRKYQSGAAKRKKVKEVKRAINECSKITTFFVDKPDDSEDTYNEKLESTITDYDDHKNEVSEIEGQSSNITINPNPIAPIVVEQQHTMHEVHNISKWPGPGNITDSFIDSIILDKPKSDTITSSANKLYKDGPEMYYRTINESDFYRKKANGTTEKREWLIYSALSNSVYCYPCKIFSNQAIGLTITNGYNDWRNLSRTLKSHENNKDHITSMCALAARLSTKGRIDSNLNLQKQIQQVAQYWRDVLKRIVATIKLLGGLGLGFRGTDENLESNTKGNYLSCLSYLAQFDSFLAEHMRSHGSKGKGHVNYLSHHVCDEFISLIAEKLKKKFVEEIKGAIYFSLILDSTPDISHFDQLTFIIRYIYNGIIVERFLGFIKISSHTAAYLTETVLDMLNKLDLKIEHCRGQSYDNAANMAGTYSGLQARIKQLSENAIYIPCANHSLNLSINFSAESCSQASDFFSFIQNLYNFFSCSTQRWNLLMKSIKNITIKKLSTTRWSARADAVLALKLNFKEIKSTLNNIHINENEKSIVRTEAKSLHKQMKSIETSILTIMWDKFLQRMNATSKSLEDPNLHIGGASNLLASLYDYIQDIRNKFEQIETEAKSIAENECYKDETSRPKKRARFADEVSENEVVLRGKEAFIVNTFNVICDNFLQDLNKRIHSYTEIYNKFKCFFSEDPKEQTESINILKQTYYADIDKDLTENEIIQFLHLCKNLNKTTIREKFDLILTDLKSTFPNVLTLLEIYFTIPISNASGERSFSNLKRIKNYLRSTMGQERFESLALLNIENEAMNSIDCDDIIDSFAQNKARRKYI